MRPIDPCAEVRRPRGRPRSERCRLAVRDAVIALLDELPYDAISVEAVAARAGVSKQTIYRWWSGKHQLAMEAYAELMHNRVRQPDTGSLERDLRVLLRRTCEVLSEPRRGTTFASLIAAAQHDPALAEAFRDSYIGVRRKMVEAILERGLQRKELRRDLDVPLAIDLLYGPVWYRLLLRNAPLDERFADAIVASFLEAFAAERAPAPTHGRRLR